MVISYSVVICYICFLAITCFYCRFNAQLSCLYFLFRAFFSVEKGSFPRVARPPITFIRKETEFLTASRFLSLFPPTQNNIKSQCQSKINGFHFCFFVLVIVDSGFIASLFFLWVTFHIVSQLPVNRFSPQPIGQGYINASRPCPIERWQEIEQSGDDEDENSLNHRKNSHDLLNSYQLNNH
ncbi:putative membrane protein (plasmid) [Aliivibrio salmonicida LFI1238]|uniref:Membrane protein n=1 Tax=Aliivibrio salmonicida (strain LFI1238) TaxID=316275 RepID=B6ET62_ALISL|nr:putative membrane protein [Aliivibrio salmonicida LFI1238]